MGGNRKLHPHLMPPLDAHIGGPRRPLTKLERQLLGKFPRHQLGERDEEVAKAYAQDDESNAVAWRP